MGRSKSQPKAPQRDLVLYDVRDGRIRLELTGVPADVQGEEDPRAWEGHAFVTREELLGRPEGWRMLQAWGRARAVDP